MSDSETQSHIPRLVLTSGEPAGIGPDVILMAAQQFWPADLLCIGDRTMLEARAEMLGIDLQFLPYTTGDAPQAHQPGQLRYIHVPAPAQVMPGTLDPANAYYVLALLSLTPNCAPPGRPADWSPRRFRNLSSTVGIPFTGHTEFLAHAFGCEQVVMLAAGEWVALATTRLPLSHVPQAITSDQLVETLTILHSTLTTRLGMTSPRITVLGLNPHAGEGGHLGREEIEVIIPVLEDLRAQGLNLTGPIPADTAFTPPWQAATDAYLAMYHDQGLPVLKSAGFGEAVNLTLGLPVVRTSVDHGTALDLAGTGKARSSSLEAAIAMAIDSAATALRT